MSRKIKLTVRLEDINDVMDSLDLVDGKDEIENGEISVIINIKDSKKNYKILSSDKVVDWDFEDEKDDGDIKEELKSEISVKGYKTSTKTTPLEVKRTDPKLEDSSTFESDCCSCCNTPKTDFKKISDMPDEYDEIIKLFTGLNRYPITSNEGICRLIDAVLNVKTTSPEFIFSYKVFEQRVLAEYISLQARDYPTHYINYITTYYAGSINFNEVFRDVLIKLKIHWSTIQNVNNLGELLLRLFTTTVGYQVKLFG